MGVTSKYSTSGAMSPIVVLGLHSNSYASPDFIDLHYCRFVLES